MAIPHPWVWSADRTNWEFGNCSINILMLGVVHNGVAFPLWWWMLDQKENSNTTERIELLKDFYQVFSDAQVVYLTADREFLGHDWFEDFLNQALLPFRIRIRESDKLEAGRQRLKAKVLFAHLQPHQHQVLRHRRKLWGHWVYVAAVRLEDQSFLIVVTAEYPHSEIADYMKSGCKLIA